MNLVEIFEAKINEYNSIQLGGYAWKFFATGRADYTNLIGTDFCGIIFILQDWNSTKTINRNNGEISESITTNAFIGMSSSLADNFYNENGTDCENKNDKIISKLDFILDNENFLDKFCKEIMYSATSKSQFLTLNYLDQNLDGYKLRFIYSS